MISHCKLRYVICKLPSILPRRVTLAYYQSRKELFTFRLFFCSLYFLFFFGTEKKAKELVLSSGAVESLQSRTDALSVVVPILDKLQLSQEALTNPAPETTKVVRCLARIAKRENRTDVVKRLRQITSAGTAGILFITSLLTVIQDLAPFSLCVVDKNVSLHNDGASNDM